MRYLIPLNSRILLRATVPAIQGGRIRDPHARTLATLGSHSTMDQMGTPPRPKTKLGVDKETLYIAGGLTAIGVVWYYYATVEHARIEKKRERLDPSAANAEGRPVDDAARTAKGRAQEALKNVH